MKTTVRRCVAVLSRLIGLSVLFLAATFSALGQWVPVNAVKGVETQPDGVVLALENGYLRFQVCTESVVHVVYSLERTVPERPDFLVIKKNWPKTEFSVNSDDAKLVTLKTAKLKIEVTRADSTIVFFDADGKRLAAETSHTLTPVEVNGEKTLSLRALRRTCGTRRKRFTGWDSTRRGVELSRRSGRHFAGQHEHLDPAAAFEQWLRDFLEQRFAQPVQQPLRTRVLPQLGSGRLDRLLLHLRPGLRQDRRRLPRTDRRQRPCSANGPTDSGNARTATSRRRNPGRRAQISRAAHSGRQHRAGLVLVEHHGRAGLQQELSRSRREWSTICTRTTST